LSDDTKRELADLMKTLADRGDNLSKLIVLGIPNAGQSLISFGKDLANRIEVIAFEANPEHKVEELVKLGERALNVSINIRDEIVAAAQGSFSIAQMLSYNTCVKAGVLQTSVDPFTTSESYETVKIQVMETLKRAFHDTTMAFSRGTKLRREGRAPYLHLLYWLSQSKNWSINADRESDRHPEQRGSVSQVVTKGFLRDLIASSPDIQGVLHFDEMSHMLIAQDPQFVFYIRNISWPTLAEEIGFISMDFPSRYDFALSFAGPERAIAEALFNKLEENELEVFYDRNEQHRILAEDIEEYLAPIYSSDAQIVICILGPEYPKRVWTKFESTQFKQRFDSGDVIPILLDSVQPGVFDLVGKVGHLTWHLTEDSQHQVDRICGMLLRKYGEVRRAQGLA
jgi:hypothetical protein